MSKQGYIARYFNIVRKLSQQKYCSFEDLSSFLEDQFEMMQIYDDTLEFNFSKRTLQRDIREIRTILGIDIVYSRSNKGYHIEQDDYSSDLFLKTIEEINSFSALKLTNSLDNVVYLEKRQPKRAEYLPDIIQAIQKKRKLEFSYLKFGETEESSRKVNPIAIKEFNNRWYLIAEEQNLIKNFGIERMSKVLISDERIGKKIEFDYDEKYQHCFGIIAPNSEEPFDVQLEVDLKQGAYLETLPLHSSQKVIKKTADKMVFGLKVYITTDFISEILSMGKFIKIIEPQILKDRIKAHLRVLNEYYN
ncbi:helix-turn-helix transcriptional regulator [Faecalibacter macacae]|uniref:WYL domain-containing protein n=1 Tax=Faecalibacter macacae TaxID=1859289 RepID=A0A3L9M4A0_9FLAO|nr:WYL domain-containing protein [Faecalibacter macacae]RLZ07353.1 WYL domain-containing protein [Faecalibacter macacae]